MTVTQAPPFDPELEALPEPRRPFRRLTFATLSLTAVLSVWLAVRMTSSVAYALSTGPAVELGELRSTELDASHHNRWVHARGTLETSPLEYRRPLDDDTFRLARVEGAPHVWVEVRIPSELDARHYLPPASFVGRLVRARNPGLRLQAVSSALAEVEPNVTESNDWLLIDGEAPSDVRWVLGLVVLLFGFALFNVWAAAHLSRPVRDP
jgi:hypothetical protein